MSLISEALKRQQLEKSGQAAPVTPPATPAMAPESTPATEAPPAPRPPVITQSAAVPAAPPPGAIRPPTPPPLILRDSMSEPGSVPRPLPASPAVAEEKTGMPPWLAFCTMCLVALLLLAGAVYGGVYAYRQFVSHKVKAAEPGTVPVATAASAPVQVDPTPVSVTPDPVATPDAVAEPATPASTAEPVADLAAIDAAEEQPAVATGEATPKPPEVAPQPPEVAPLPPEAQATAVAKPAVTWPRLTVSGLVGSKNGGAAIVNGEIVGLGEMIAEAQIIALSKDGVKFEYRGETRSVRIGGTIE